MVTVQAIHRGIPVVHAAPGCAYNLYLGQVIASGFQGQGYIGGACLSTTRLCERDVVYGGEERLRRQLKATLDIVDGDFVVIMTGCVSDLIGDNVTAVAKEFNTKEVPVFSVETGGFKGNSFRGYERVLEAFADHLMEESSSKEKGLVNVFGVVPYQDMLWRGNLKEISRVLERLGLEANMMLGHRIFGLESWRKAPRAELNLLLSPWVGVEFVQEFEQKFGVPHLIFPGLPIGPTETSKLLRMVGERLDVSKNLVDKVVTEEEKEVYYYLEDTSDLYIDFGWQFNFAVIGDTNLVLGVNKFLTNDMGYEPVLTIITDDPPDKYRETIISELTNLDYGLKPEIVFESNSDKIWEILEKSRAQVILGSSLDRPIAVQLGAAHLSIGCPTVNRLITDNTSCGYKGARELISDIVTAVMVAST
jgi:nitrogenase molybdenum-iron protein beta chain